jgi:hypothetical protein
LQPELPSPSQETCRPKGDGVSKASHASRTTQQLRRFPLRLVHLMALVAAVAVTLVVAPALLKAIMKPLSGMGPQEVLFHTTSLALILWTPILAVIAVIRNRSRLRRASRSYGTSAVFAAASAVCLLLVHGLIATWLGSFRGFSVFRVTGSSLKLMAIQLVGYRAPPSSATAIIAVWLILALTGAGRKPSGWLEILSFLFGLLWVLWYFVGYLVLYYTKLPWL